MLIIKINHEYEVMLTDKTEPVLIDYIKQKMQSGEWTEDTPIEAIERGKVIDSGKIKDFFSCT